jgi:hypothetical protein
MTRIIKLSPVPSHAPPSIHSFVYSTLARCHGDHAVGPQPHSRSVSVTDPHVPPLLALPYRYLRSSPHSLAFSTTYSIVLQVTPSLSSYVLSPLVPMIHGSLDSPFGILLSKTFRSTT